jgi:hypothetical protein
MLAGNESKAAPGTIGRNSRLGPPLTACRSSGGCDSEEGGSVRPEPPFLLTPGRMQRIRPHLALSCGVPRVDDRRVISGIIHAIRHGLQWRAAPACAVYGPQRTLYNRFVRWSRRASSTASPPPSPPNQVRRSG